MTKRLKPSLERLMKKPKFSVLRPAKESSDFPGCVGYRCQFEFYNRSLTTSYYLPLGVDRQPTAVEVMNCLGDRLILFQNSGSIEGFSELYGYRMRWGSIMRTRSLWKVLQRNEEKLRALWRNHFDTFALLTRERQFQEIILAARAWRRMTLTNFVRLKTYPLDKANQPGLESRNATG